MTSFQEITDSKYVTPWYQAEDKFMNERYTNVITITEEQKTAFIETVTIGYNLLKEGYDKQQFNPQFTIDFHRFFYRYTDERLLAGADFHLIDNLLKAFDTIIEKNRKDNELTTRICHCHDYYCDTLCDDRYDYRNDYS
jgi:hypothetical protein